jgi:hypothetical protein
MQTPWGVFPIIDLQHFVQYRMYVINLIRYPAWILFLKRMYKRITDAVY